MRQENLLYRFRMSSNGTFDYVRYNDLDGLDLEKLKMEYLKEETTLAEAKRKAFVETQKQAIIKKAKAESFQIKETNVGNKIKIILRRTV